MQASMRGVYPQSLLVLSTWKGQGDLASSLITPIIHIVTLNVPIISPPDPPSREEGNMSLTVSQSTIFVHSPTRTSKQRPMQWVILCGFQDPKALRPSYSPPEAERMWDIWGSYSNSPNFRFYLPKGDYTLGSREAQGSKYSKGLGFGVEGIGYTSQECGPSFLV